MNTSSPLVLLGEVLKPISRPESVDPEKTYKILGAHWYAKGLYIKDILPGSEIRADKAYRVEEGDFVYNRLFAWKGSFAVARKQDSGCYVSNEFPCFAVNRDRADPLYLWKYFSRTSAWDEALGLSTGGTPTSRNRLKEEKFLALKVPLPPLSEQRRIVARIEELAAKINEARTLRQQATQGAEVIVSRATSRLLDEAGWPIHPLGELLTESPRNGLSPKPEIVSNGRPMLRINAVSSSPSRFVDLTAIKLVEVSKEEAAPFELRNNDVFIVRYNGDINRVAKPGIYKGNDPCYSVYPDKLMRLRPDHSKMIPDFLVFALSSRNVREQVEEIGKTTAGNIGISGGNAKSFRLPVPPLVEQCRIVAELDALQSQVDTLKTLQSETAAELDALMPSILDRAVKGDLLGKRSVAPNVL
ncbi:MAG: restriction endonuclease subunit S [Deltaproteobacteria bacterium]|nr:restriction endonuclease subunit S [Deltaproteobacteria bacterium]